MMMGRFKKLPNHQQTTVAKKPIKKRPSDPNQLAKVLVDELTGQEESPKDSPKKNLAAVSLGRLGGLKGGPARAKKLTKEQRSESARKAATARWNTKPAKDK